MSRGVSSGRACGHRAKMICKVISGDDARQNCRHKLFKECLAKGTADFDKKYGSFPGKFRKARPRRRRKLFRRSR